jgi:hypothetical protein
MYSRFIKLISSLYFILIVSVLLRLGAAFYLGQEVVTLPGTADQISYHTLAIRILDGNGFSFGEAWWPATGAGEPTAHWSFLYTIYLVVVYSIFGPSPLAARLIQALIVGILQPFLAYRLAQVAFDPFPGMDPKISKRVPVLAAWITAIYFYFIYYAVTLMTEAFFIIAVMAVLLLTVRISVMIAYRGFWKSAVVLGLAISAAVLLRQLFLLFLPFIFLWLWLVGKKNQAFGRAFVASGISLILLLAAILPFTYYNYIRFHRFVLLNTNAGYVLFWANHPIHGRRFIPASEMGDTYQKLIPSNLRILDEAALDQELLKEGMRFILDDPGRYFVLSLSRIVPYIKFWPDNASGMISNLARVGSFGLLLPLMVYGLVRPYFYLRREKIDRLNYFLTAPVALLYEFVIVYSAIHVLTWTLIRYRLPVDSILVIFSAVALAGLIPDIKLLLANSSQEASKRAGGDTVKLG